MWHRDATMRSCANCSTAILAGQRFCGGCGASVDEGRSLTRTRIHESPATPTSSPEESRFTPGTVLAGRYRIVGPLGRGGMGEVYRADDLKLGQSVALKFLPESLEHDAPRKARLLTEVRLARQVSHPNVCRVYDIGELDGLPFISMEYVDGEDLASLLRRIGRLPAEKGLETARQICAGLAAAHEQGILHRDLKPANVMIDGRGRVKITDFGLAGLAEDLGAHEIRSGTPAYMAPEQLAGHEVSIRSDIYALGLVLYELVTGKQAFGGKSGAEIARRQQETQPTLPSRLVSDLDEATERVILCCLEKDPRSRPGSALAVAAALPGGDPLAAALAAGETPSPELVAEAGEAGGLKPLWAAVLLVLSLAGMVFMGWRYRTLETFVPFDLSADELTVKARQMLERLGHAELEAPHAVGFAPHWKYLEWVRDNVQERDRWERLRSARPPGVEFYYRYGPEALQPTNAHTSRVSESDPPLIEPGSAVLRLDTLGRLSDLDSIPVALGQGPESFDWSVALELAGLAPEDLEPTAPVRPPSSPSTALRAWTLPASGDGIEPVVQLGSVGGRLTYFELIGPWNRPGEPEPAAGSSPTFGSVVAVVLVIAIFLAVRNLKAGRSDTRGAFRLALFTVVTMQVAWLLSGVRLHSLDVAEVFFELVWGRALGHALLHATLAWTLYVALEPYVRRLWPHMLVSWTRLLRGRFRDPLLGRDVLIGFVAGFVVAVIGRCSAILAHGMRAGLDPLPTASFLAWGDIGPREVLSEFLNGIQAASYVPLGLTVAILLLRMLLRRDWAAIAAFIVLFGVGGTLGDPSLRGTAWGLTAVVVASSMTASAIFALVIVRGGLVAIIATFLSLRLTEFPLTWDLSRWYAGSSLTAMAIFAAVAAWAFYISLAGRPVFKDSLRAGG
jgi:serine/threonine-protein kinase